MFKRKKEQHKNSWLHYEEFPYDKAVPSVDDIINGFQRLFIEHVTLNPSEVTWKSYGYQLNTITYRSFLYAFAYEIGRIDPKWNVAAQLQKNASSLSLFLQGSGIKLTDTEKSVLEIATKFTKWNCSESAREKISQESRIRLWYEYRVSND